MARPVPAAKRRLAARLRLVASASAVTVAWFAPLAAAEAPRHVVLVSIDGLIPAVYTRPDELELRVPNLRRLVADGASATGVVGVLPSVTYPSHTTIVTGLPPRAHGIWWNTYFDPLGISNDAWLWYAREIRAPTLASATRARGRTVGSVSWPVSVGLEVDFLLPEFWRTGSTHPSDLELVRALATPGLVDAVEAFRGRPLDWPATDAGRTDAAIAILEAHRPALLMLHLLEVDKEEHTHGPRSAEARAAIEASDAQLGSVLAALARLGLADRTLVAVVSDHGFVDARRVIRPNWLLAEQGLMTVDAKGKVTGWKAAFHSHGGTASLRLADPKDEATRTKVRELLAAKLREPGSGIAAILERAELDRLGADPEAELMLEAADGFSISRTPAGGWQGEAVDRGYHGFDPRRPAMHAALILAGPGVAAGRDLGVVPMTSIAPTLARFLGVELAPEAGAPIELALAAN